MKQFARLRLFLSLIIMGAFLSTIAVPAFAASSAVPEGRMQVVMTIDKLPKISMGDSFVLSGTIRDRLGTPISGKSIVFYMNGAVLGQASSDVNGKFSRKFSKPFDAGTYKITGVSKESHLYFGTSFTTTLDILPATIFVQTTPAIQGVPFTLNGVRFVSDSDGLARIKVSKVGDYSLVVLADQYHNPIQKVEFGRWLEEIYLPYRVLSIPKEKFIQVGLNVYHLMSQSFVDADGYPVDPSRVNQFSFRSLQGDSFTFQDGAVRWIPASRVTRWKSILQITRMYYSVTSVTIDGSNVVNQSEQRFYTTAGGTWQISLILYSLKVTAQDGLFGTPVGKSASLEYPDGHVQTFPFDASGSATVHSLARGTYYIVINGVNGMKSRTPVALSKNQVVNSKILTSTDLLLTGGILTLLALALLFAGRPWLIQVLMRRQRAVIGSARMTLSSRKSFNEEDFINMWMSQGVQTAISSGHEPGKPVGLSREGFDRLLIYLEGILPKPGRPTKLDLSEQLALTLKYLRGKASERNLAVEYHVSVSTVGRTVKRINDGLMTCSDFKNDPDSRDQPKEAGVLSQPAGRSPATMSTGAD